jgi:hypothetical protein
MDKALRVDRKFVQFRGSWSPAAWRLRRRRLRRQNRRWSPPLPITSSKAAHLWDAVCRGYEVRAFGQTAYRDEVFHVLVVARIIEPTGKADSLRVIEETGVAPVSYPTLNRPLPVFAKPTFRQALSTSCAAHAALGPASLVLYDVTMLPPLGAYLVHNERPDGLSVALGVRCWPAPPWSTATTPKPPKCQRKSIGSSTTGPPPSGCRPPVRLWSPVGTPSQYNSVPARLSPAPSG